MADFKRAPIDLAHLGSFFLWMLCVGAASAGIGLMMAGLQLIGFEGELAKEAARSGAETGPKPGLGYGFLGASAGAFVLSVLIGFGALKTWRWARKSDKQYTEAHPDRDDMAGLQR